jgi:hypothetical protein
VTPDLLSGTGSLRSQCFYPKSGSWMIACVGRIGRTVGDGPIAASASASPNG